MYNSNKIKGGLFGLIIGDTLGVPYEFYRADDEMVGTGGGYVIDCLRSTFMILKKATSYEQAVKDAVALGNDTDTTAAVTGGLAGILFGFSSIPQRWIDGLRSKEIVDKLIKIK